MTGFLVWQAVFCQELRFECGKCSCGDVRADLTHELQLEVEIVNRGQVQPQNLARLK